VLWAGRNRTNFAWLHRHALALCEEYTARYGRIHRCQPVIEAARPPRSLPIGITEFVQCMPEQFRGKDPVEAYRRYYHSKSFAQWNKTRPAPYWWNQE
jgi:hypothetical protein